jgi:hypothetical protein
MCLVGSHQDEGLAVEGPNELRAEIVGVPAGLLDDLHRVGVELLDQAVLDQLLTLDDEPRLGPRVNDEIGLTCLCWFLGLDSVEDQPVG